MKKYVISGILILAGIFIAFPLFSLTYYTMVRTSTPQFCSSCHEIQFAYNTWKTASHANNAEGFVADCIDYHLPAPHDTFNFFYTKTAHGFKDIIAHFTEDQSLYDHELQRKNAYASFKNEQCQKCHQNILNIPDKRGAMLAHSSVIYARPGYEKQCVDCHKNLVHNARSFYEYKQYKLSYSSLGK